METKATPLTRVCPGCGIEKDASEFGKTNRRNGLRTYCRACEKVRQKKQIETLKEQIYDKLGHVCFKCGFSDKRALQIDHVNGGGNKEHKEIKSATTYLQKVIADTLGTYQILCANCNWIKRMERREHPRGNKISPEGMQRILSANQNKTPTEEQLRKLSEAHKGLIPWNKGKVGVYSLPPVSEEHRAKLSIAAKEREAAKTPEQRSEEARKRANDKTPEERSQIARNREAVKRQKNPPKGRVRKGLKRTPEQKVNYSLAATKREADKRAKRELLLAA